MSFVASRKGVYQESIKSRGQSARYPSAPRYPSSLSILGVQLSPVSVDDLHSYIVRVIEQKQRALIMHMNVHCANLCQKHSWLRNFLNQAQLVFCDGDGVRWGARILGLNPPPKITYDRWIWQLAELADKKGYRFFFFGGKPGVAEEAARKICQRFPGLEIAGTHHGYINQEGEENNRVIDLINQAKPDILLLGLGMPIQEKWLCDHWRSVDAHVLLTGGAVFDYASGNARRAPAWMIRLNLEWLFRLLQEPGRLCVRYVWGNPYFMLRILQEKWFPRNGTK